MTKVEDTSSFRTEAEWMAGVMAVCVTTQQAAGAPQVQTFCTGVVPTPSWAAPWSTVQVVPVPGMGSSGVTPLLASPCTLE